ncbi:PREDICTED: hemoglobin subunit alpha-3-like [Nanorana parkeri]|uniref:hemoglobin subunit alpha-3-like n=1 Tax=Nanorana parkeri TaxID=125878 RepID=UPI0008540F30|nr:PREDICTED: hemoglobin subunit alpha-3-like [Nanorana parkeri]
MSLTASDKAAVRSIWNKVSHQASELGGEIMDRLFTNHPQTKHLFSHIDLTPGSADIKAEGGKLMDVIGNAVNHMDDLAGNLSTKNLPVYKLWTDPKTNKHLPVDHYLIERPNRCPRRANPRNQQWTENWESAPVLHVPGRLHTFIHG